MSHQTSDIITPKALLLDERLTPLERNACRSRRRSSAWYWTRPTGWQGWAR